MATALYTHADALRHLTPPGHPEQVDRLRAIARALDAPAFAGLARVEAPKADRADLLRVHPESHIASIEAQVPLTGFNPVDGDTFLSPGSLDAALRAAGGACAAVDAVMAGQAGNAFVAMRPPGHHAERDRAMGFCLFSSVAIAAKRAVQVHGLDRVAIVDFDVHHGNGTQDAVWDDPAILFVSSHQWPLYPGTGRPSETGAHGNVLNVTLPPNSDGAAMRTAYDTQVWPELEEFEPELILVSAGFDAHADDPLANLRWREADFAWLTRRLCDLAQAHCGGRLVSCLEGGYDLDALAASVAAHVTVLMEHSA